MLEVVSYSMLTPLGDMEQTFAAVNAGVNVYQESSFINRNNQPMIMCEVPLGALPDLDDHIKPLNVQPRRERIIRLASGALAELISNNVINSPVPVLLAVPEKLPGKRTPIDDRYFKLILRPHLDLIDIDNSYVFPYGRAAIAQVLETASQLLANGVVQQVIVGGVDSFHDSDLLEDLDLSSRVLAAGVVDGFAPSEASSFLLLQQAQRDSKVSINGWASSKEVGHRYSEEPYLAEALSSAVTTALTLADTNLANTQVHRLYANLNGESFFSKEWGIAQLRNQKFISDDVAIEHPADCFGDVGAAFGPLMIAIATKHLEEMAKPETVLLCASSELDTRAAVVLSYKQIGDA